MKKLETTFKEKVLADLKRLDNAWFLKTQEVAVRGIPDILMCLNGAFIGIELKKDAKSKPDELQQYHLKKIRKAWGHAFVAHPDNWDRIFREIRSIT